MSTHGTLPASRAREDADADADVDAEEDPDPSGVEPETPKNGAVLCFPTRVGAGYDLTAEKLDEYQDSFPGVDVLGELRHARQHLLDNPRSLRSAPQVPGYLTAWLGRAKNGKPERGGRKPAAKSALDQVIDANAEYFGAGTTIDGEATHD